MRVVLEVAQPLLSPVSVLGFLVGTMSNECGDGLIGVRHTPHGRCQRKAMRGIGLNDIVKENTQQQENGSEKPSAAKLHYWKR